MKTITLSEKFRSFISSEKLFSPDQKVLVAVSGGIDSVVLCDLLISRDLNSQLRTAISNFGAATPRKTLNL